MSEQEFFEDDGLYNYSRRVHRYKQSILKIRQGQTCVDFLNKLSLGGRSDGRILVYAGRLKIVLEQFNKYNVQLESCTKKDCENILSSVLQKRITVKRNFGKPYSGEIKRAFALAIKRLVHYAKTDEIGNTDDGYVDEVKWIKPSRYEDKEEKIKPEDLLTNDEFLSLIDNAPNKMFKALFWLMLEGAFRPSEILNFRIGGIEFKENYVLASTHGKTGRKRVPIVTAFRPVLEWLLEHPHKDDPTAYLWYSKQARQKRITYKHLRETLSKSAKKAEIKKPVWNYLLRHTQLTTLSKKLSDQTLCVFGNWSRGSKMPSKYSHLSGKDAEDALLQLHGIVPEEKNTLLKLRACPRCEKDNTPDSKRCAACGFILDAELLSKVSDSDEKASSEMQDDIAEIKENYVKVTSLLNSLLQQKPVKIQDNA